MRAKPAKRKALSPDSRYNSLEVTKLINRSMKNGKKAAARHEIYAALELLAQKTKEKPLDILLAALNNIKPKTEVRSRRVGGASYQVPVPVTPTRQFSISIRWLLEYANQRSNSEYHTFGEKLAAEIMDAYNNTGAAIKKRDDVHRMADANKAFAHFRW
ncbi:MAG: 30S ribosomal protein S7 [Microgenomates group bacterium GW2011_GWC1_46_16]|jgi:small subunit ribosomal protein S7|uniref:Small ribosomal subunit protein uS7 n=2 Tax=Candidatus Collieribacteriota TaxID=1752725 RepID=A0A1F5FXH2_9BACT|nr:MAG: 30S ribosomal protein S7 [Microgenomates group bacterium GW2011_GWF1_46_12]KKU26902.1 MAG: 30S ribosomal protein S7 [Microgenomates group bacterium GW2011_GWC1_46_16]KKU28319.1 MAG: 30S ribosomal protein S7 [Microgenomates group bacterium GW2011_GWF2_46_18]KKU42947.1 MAG: 30S ribosomal protein S7 [Microgenomates group bacterium GW2011_GWA1_46_7]KKU45544.1 MAG: 30S ribosomal protein S7 [Microgenomates group bacterium GW2011_GWB1_46_7]KKU62136.1 MAG: 30S ribosomal protein S7 [Microgenoma